MNTTKNLSAGTVTVYDFGKIKLHAYDTKDALCDAAFIDHKVDSGDCVFSFVQNIFD